VVLSTLTKRTPDPTGIVITSGENPRAEPAGVDCAPNAAILTSTVVTLETLPELPALA
jgi:hypothetical protein